ncbi:hypothetical protein ACFL24_01545 [Patescibacteria group bacterium]
MSFENGDVSELAGGDKKEIPLYRKRAFESVEENLDYFQKIESGEIEPLQLDELERKEVLDWEKELGNELESIWEREIAVQSFFTEYFLTTEGQKDLLILLKQEDNLQKAEEIYKLKDVTQIEKFLLEHDQVISESSSSKEIKNIAGSSQNYAREAFLKSFDNGLGEAVNPHVTTLLSDSSEARSKIEELREFKDKLKGSWKEFENLEDNQSQSKKAVLNIYARRVNELIVGAYGIGALIAKKQEILNLNDKDFRKVFENESAFISALDARKRLIEKKLEQGIPIDGSKESKRFTGERLELNISRMDKFLYGASEYYNEEGEREAISGEIRELANSREEEIKASLKSIEEREKEKGINYHIGQLKVKADEVVGWLKDFLKQQGMLSKFDPENYSPDRNERAKDNKWQIVREKGRKSFAVESYQGVIKSPIEFSGETQDKKIEVGFPLACHEILHAIQGDNEKKIGLKILDKIGSDRGSIMSEAGAVMIENAIKDELFGSMPGGLPNYLRAMERRVEGGNFKDCSEALFESAKRIHDYRLENNFITKDDYDRLINNTASAAFDDTLRLFRGNSNFSRNFYQLSNLSSTEPFLWNSQPSVYLEQNMLVKELERLGQENLLLIRGVNFETLGDLLYSGLLTLKDIPPKDVPEKIKNDFLEFFDEIKGKYETELSN